MGLAKGDHIPDATLLTMGADGPQEVSLNSKLSGRKVVIFGLPGAYTGTCTTSHVPSFIRTIDQFKEKGVDEIICVSVNDPFVMAAWGDSTGAADAGITMLADAAGEFTKSVGMDFTAPPVGFFGRSKRYAMIVDNGTVSAIGEETSPGECDISGGEALLQQA